MDNFKYYIALIFYFKYSNIIILKIIQIYVLVESIFTSLYLNLHYASIIKCKVTIILQFLLNIFFNLI
jgi:hypothetical protein